MTSSGAGVETEQCRQIMEWRKLERLRLLEARLSVSADLRLEWAEQMTKFIIETTDFQGKVMSFYWPFKGEPDLRPLMGLVSDRGGRCALPVVVEKARPLEFWAWKPGEALDRGVWNIPVPRIRVPVVPDIVLAPVVGFDAAGFRLGYGGGFFDRTLAAMAARPLAIGVGYQMAAIETIHPLSHDMPMSVIITELGPQPVPAAIGQ